MDINLHNKNLIYKIFPKLDNNHKKYIIDSINEICVVIEEHIFKKDKYTFVSQMKLNDSKDILGFVILLLPYFDFFKCYEIESLDDIFKDTQSSKKVFSEKQGSNKELNKSSGKKSKQAKGGTKGSSEASEEAEESASTNSEGEEKTP